MQSQVARQAETARFRTGGHGVEAGGARGEVEEGLGHRLGAAVKVANLRNLMQHDPATKRIVTTNAETNAWMVAINERLGFVPVAVVPTFKRRLTL